MSDSNRKMSDSNREKKEEKEAKGYQIFHTAHLLADSYNDPRFADVVLECKVAPHVFYFHSILLSLIPFYKEVMESLLADERHVTELARPLLASSSSSSTISPTNTLSSTSSSSYSSSYPCPIPYTFTMGESITKKEQHTLKRPRMRDGERVVETQEKKGVTLTIKKEKNTCTNLEEEDDVRTSASTSLKRVRTEKGDDLPPVDTFRFRLHDEAANRSTLLVLRSLYTSSLVYPTTITDVIELLREGIRLQLSHEVVRDWLTHMETLISSAVVLSSSFSVLEFICSFYTPFKNLPTMRRIAAHMWRWLSRHKEWPLDLEPYHVNALLRAYADSLDEPENVHYFVDPDYYFDYTEGGNSITQCTLLTDLVRHTFSLNLYCERKHVDKKRLLPFYTHILRHLNLHSLSTLTYRGIFDEIGLSTETLLEAFTLRSQTISLSSPITRPLDFPPLFSESLSFSSSSSYSSSFLLLLRLLRLLLQRIECIQ